MDREHHLKRLGFRAWHRGTREADYMIGGLFDRYAAEWSDEEIAWFERLIEQEDVDIMAWAMGKEPVPADRPDNLFEPVDHDFGTHGRFDDRSRKFSAQLWVNTHREVVLAGVLGGVLLMLGGVFARTRPDRDGRAPRR